MSKYEINLPIMGSTTKNTKRIGITNHFFERNNQRYCGMELNEFVDLFWDSKFIEFTNPTHNDLESFSFTNECYRFMVDKHIKKGGFQHFIVFPKLDMIVVVVEGDLSKYGYTTKPFGWNDYVISTIYKCTNGVNIEVELPKVEMIKVGNKYYPI